LGNLKKRLERLEGGRKGRGFPVIIMMYEGETEEEARQQHLAEHSDDEKAEVSIIIHLSGTRPQRLRQLSALPVL
jgi:hypothetical protein